MDPPLTSWDAGPLTARSRALNFLAPSVMLLSPPGPPSGDQAGGPENVTALAPPSAPHRGAGRGRGPPENAQPVQSPVSPGCCVHPMSPLLAWASMCVPSLLASDLRHRVSATYPSRTRAARHRRRADWARVPSPAPILIGHECGLILVMFVGLAALVGGPLHLPLPRQSSTLPQRGGWRNRQLHCALPLPNQWSKAGAPLLLQTRVKTLNHELGAVFKRWYPDLEVEELAEAA